jgi:hypothetical protein
MRTSTTLPSIEKSPDGDKWRPHGNSNPGLLREREMTRNLPPLHLTKDGLITDFFRFDALTNIDHALTSLSRKRWLGFFISIFKLPAWVCLHRLNKRRWGARRSQKLLK